MRRVRLDEARCTSRRHIARTRVRRRRRRMRRRRGLRAGMSTGVVASMAGAAPGPAPRLSCNGWWRPWPVRLGPRRSAFLEAVADAVEGLDHVEGVVDDLELLAQALDVAVDGTVVDIDLVVIGRVHEGVAALDDARALGERLQDQELGDGERDGV